ncbi:MAG: YceI family protein [Saprospiraceae bacterium]|nr:YceI family protein [Saprospiraceae bacterium]
MKFSPIIILLLFTHLLSAQTKNLQVEPNHSTIGFSISIAGFSVVTGKYTDYEIFMEWDDEDLSNSKIISEIKASSINTGIPDRDDHLQSSDFFDVEKFPLITFESDSIQQVNFSNFEAHGKLTMHGITKNLILPFQIVKADGNVIGFKARTTINRLDYGVGSEFQHTSMPEFLADVVEVQIDFWTRKRKE